MIQISKSALTQHVNNGLKREEIIALYSTSEHKLPNSVLSTMLKQCGLTIKKTRKQIFELVDNVPLVGDVTENQQTICEALKGNAQIEGLVNNNVISE